MSRKFVVAALAAACVIGFGACGSVQAESSVKSSKSNTSERTKGGGQNPAARTTTVKSSKSNTSDRTRGGVRGGGAPDKAINLNSSRSNSNY